MADATTAATAPTVKHSTNDFLLTKQVKQHNKELGKDQFLQIILTQLQNQDPTAPMDDANFITQMSQLTNLESMSLMANSFQQTQTYAMIGKGVTGIVKVTDGETGLVTQEEVIGTVDSAGVENGKPYVLVQDKKIFVENISQVFDKSIISGSSQDMLAGTAMVGKFVRAEIPDGNGGKSYAQGQVKRVEMSEGQLMVVLGDARVALYQVVTVADSAEGLGN